LQEQFHSSTSAKYKQKAPANARALYLLFFVICWFRRQAKDELRKGF